MSGRATLLGLALLALTSPQHDVHADEYHTPAPAPGVFIPPPPPPAAYKFVIVADTDEAAATAGQMVALMKSLPPFDQMGNQLAFEIVRADTAKLNCRSDCDANSARLICCDRDFAAVIGAQHGAHRTIVVTSNANGGSGGTIPLASTKYPLPTTVHEILHSYGMGDEYEYSEKETKAFCSPADSYSNIACFDAKASYENDGMARSQHHGAIPWYGAIAPFTLITTGSQLGTAPKIYPDGTPALFHGGGCSKRLDCWRPYDGANIMSNAKSTFIPLIHQDIIVRKMSAERGHTIHLIKRESCATCK